VGERGLADAGQILDQEMPAGEKSGKGHAHLRRLAQQHGVDLIERGLERCGQGRIDRRGRRGRNQRNSHEL